MKRYQILFILVISVAMFILLLRKNTDKPSDFNQEDLTLITNTDTLMRVLTTESEKDLKILRKTSNNLTLEDLKSENFQILTKKMIATVTSPEQNGVGIAAPQVGINKRIIAVQRFDKEGEPFEIYANIKIVETSGDKECGPEGCLSVPNLSGEVDRYRDIVIEYVNLETFEYIKENIQGFTAVIFQHEIDHLDGILYTDRLSK